MKSTPFEQIFRIRPAGESTFFKLISGPFESGSKFASASNKPLENFHFQLKNLPKLIFTFFTFCEFYVNVIAFIVEF